MREPILDWWTKTAARRLTLSNIRDLKSGTRAKISGIVVDDGGAISAPLSERPCYAYSVVGDTGQRRARMAWEYKFTPFVVKDDTGLVLINADDDCVLTLGSSHEINMRLWERRKVEPNATAFFARHGRTVDTHFRFVREGILSPGTRVVVYGAPVVAAVESPYRQGITASFARKGVKLITDDVGRYG